MSRTRGARAWVWLSAALLLNAALLWAFHDRHWYPIDEGNYAHVAERLVAGQVMHRDVQDLHLGYINFLNAAALGVFGMDLVSLRYPLVAAAFVQSVLVWLLFARRSLLLATTASLGVTALGVIQFLDPTAHWYCLFLGVALVCWLTWVPRAHPARVFGAGVLVGLIAMFRQLTGVWVAMAVLVLLLRERSTDAQGRHAAAGRALLAAALLALVSYLALAGGPEPGGILLVASWPLWILVVALRDLKTTNRATAGVVLPLAAGGLVPALPLVAYHLVHGSLAAWVDDTVFAAFGLTAIPFFEENAPFAVMPAAGLFHVLGPVDATAFTNGLYWLIVPLLPALNGALVILWLRRRGQEPPIVPIVAAFYALVTLHLSGPNYLYYATGLTLAAVVWFATQTSVRWHVPGAAAAVSALALIAVAFHAGQSPYRQIAQVARGHRTVTSDTEMCPPFPRSSLRLTLEECDAYHRLARAIEAETTPDSRIFVLPSDAELYFLAARTNPFRFYNSAIGIRSAEDLREVVRHLSERPPRVVAYRPDDKYNTDASRRVMEHVRAGYDRFDTIGGVELYRPRHTSVLEAD